MANTRAKRKRKPVPRVNPRSMTREQLKRYNAKKRRKILRRQRRVFLACLAAWFILTILLILRLFGVFEERAETTTLTVNEDGSITFEEVAVVSDASADEVKAFIKDAIRTYNKEQGKRLVRLKRISEKKGTVYARSTYADAACYADFTGLELFSGTIAEAQSSGYDLSDIYARVSDGKKGSLKEISEVLSDKHAQVLIVGQNLCVCVPGDIRFVTDNATKVDGNLVTINTGDEKSLVTTAIIYELPSGEKE